MSMALARTRNQSLSKSPSDKDFIPEPSFDRDFILCPDSTVSDDMSIDLEDITKRGVLRASLYSHKDRQPLVPIYHPHDARLAGHPSPPEWQRMFDDLPNQPRTRSPSIISVDTTAATPPASRRGSLQPPAWGSSSCSCSRSSYYTEHTPSAACSSPSHRSYPAAHTPRKHLSTLLSGISCQSHESLLLPHSSGGYLSEMAPSSRRSSKTHHSTRSTTTSASSCRHSSRSRSRNTALFLSHMYGGDSHYRMDGDSSDLQQMVSDIPVSALLRPITRLPGHDGVESGPVQEDHGFDDAYPLRETRLWAFGSPEPPNSSCASSDYLDDNDDDEEEAEEDGWRII